LALLDPQDKKEVLETQVFLAKMERKENREPVETKGHQDCLENWE